MKQSLQLKIGQSLTLTPQLQQAIKLLQLSTLDLQQAIEETLASNPLLERDENQPEAAAEQDIDFSARATATASSRNVMRLQSRSRVTCCGS